MSAVLTPKEITGRMASLKFGPRPTAWECASFKEASPSGEAMGYEPAMGRLLLQQARREGFDWETLAEWSGINGTRQYRGRRQMKDAPETRAICMAARGKRVLTEAEYDRLYQALHGE